jgi:peptidoglycan L-alanyl-D-glutamate endopeptidase CwlK
MINSRSLTDLDPAARMVCNDHLARCSHAGIELIITSTYRDFIAQDALYAIGRTVHPERRHVTNAKAGQSFHNFRVAWDVVPIVSGKPVWDDKDPLWKEVIMHGKDAGAEAGADWPLFPDKPHFQIRPLVQGVHISLDEAMERFRDRGTIFA